MTRTVLLLVAMVFLAGRAAGMVLGPWLGWVLVLAAPVLSLRALTRHPLMLPTGTQRLEPWQAPEFFQTLRLLATRARLAQVPAVYILPSRRAEAFTTGVGSRAMILISRGVFEILSAREIAAVLAHEISHIRNLDLPLFVVAGAMQNLTRLMAGFLLILVVATLPMLLFGIVPVPPQALLYMGVVPAISLLAQLALLRTREFQADAGAVELTGDPAALVQALVRIESLQRPWWNGMIGTGGRSSVLQRLLRTHPGTDERVRRLGELL